jgi:hypothetical protein
MDLLYIREMEDFILRLWIDGLIEDYPIIDRIAKERGLTEYIQRIRDTHDELVKKLMDNSDYQKKIFGKKKELDQ